MWRGLPDVSKHMSMHIKGMNNLSLQFPLSQLRGKTSEGLCAVQKNSG